MAGEDGREANGTDGMRGAGWSVCGEARMEVTRHAGGATGATWTLGRAVWCSVLCGGSTGMSTVWHGQDGECDLGTERERLIDVMDGSYGENFLTGVGEMDDRG